MKTTLCKITFFLLYLFLTTGCKAQNKEELSEPVDLMSPASPFIIERQNVISLPENLKGKGFAVLTVYVDSNEKLKGFNINKLQIDTNNLSYINEGNLHQPMLKNEFPNGVQKYYNFLLDYVESLKLKRDEKVKLESLNEITFLVRLK